MRPKWLIGEAHEARHTTSINRAYSRLTSAGSVSPHGGTSVVRRQLRAGGNDAHLELAAGETISRYCPSPLSNCALCYLSAHSWARGAGRGPAPVALTIEERLVRCVDLRAWMNSMACRPVLLRW